MTAQPHRQSEFSAEYLERARRRFRAKCKEEGGHLLWTGGRQFRFGAEYSAVTAQRAAWLLFRGDLPPAPLAVLAPCRPSGECMNPEHLVAADPVQLARLRPRTGPGVGEANARAKLQELEVRLIHWLYGRGWTNRELAGPFGVSRALVSQIATGYAWPHLGLPPIYRPRPVSRLRRAKRSA